VKNSGSEHFFKQFPDGLMEPPPVTPSERGVQERPTAGARQSCRKDFAPKRALTPNLGQKKSPLLGGLESIFLEENRGDRKHDAARHKNRPMTIHDDSHSPGE
jgi:hypothetical protein